MKAGMRRGCVIVKEQVAPAQDERYRQIRFQISSFRAIAASARPSSGPSSQLTREFGRERTQTRRSLPLIR